MTGYSTIFYNHPTSKSPGKYELPGSQAVYVDPIAKSVWRNDSCITSDYNLLYPATVESNSFFQSGKAVGGEVAAIAVDYYISRPAGKKGALYTDADFLVSANYMSLSSPVAKFTAEAHANLITFFGVAALNDVVPVEYQQIFKYAVGVAAISAASYFGQSSMVSAGKISGWVAGFATYDYVVKPILGETLQENFDNNLTSMIKLGYSIYAVDSFVGGINAAAGLAIPTEYVFAASFVKTFVDPALFNYMYDYGGFADQDAMGYNAAFNVLGIAMQIGASFMKTNSDLSARDYVKSSLAQQAIIFTAFESGLFASEYVVKSVAQSIGSVLTGVKAVANSLLDKSTDIIPSFNELSEDPGYCLLGEEDVSETCF